MGRPWALSKRLESAERHFCRLMEKKPIFRTFVEKAKKERCIVEPVHHLFNGEPTGTVRNTALVINGCFVELNHHAEMVKHPDTTREKVVFGWRVASPCWGRILLVLGEEPLFFVVPRRMLPAVGGISIAFDRALPQHLRTQRDYWTYQDAWYLLNKKPTTS